MEKTYKIPGSAIIHELLDNEVIIANLDNGVYYSLRYCGIQVWQLLLAGKTLPEVTHLFVEHYPKIPHHHLEHLLTSFVNQLVAEALLKPVDGKNSAAVVNESDIVWPADFGDPLFEKYEEMKDLLMLDPIHEVDEQGWPHPKEG